MAALLRDHVHDHLGEVAVGVGQDGDVLVSVDHQNLHQAGISGIALCEVSRFSSIISSNVTCGAETWAEELWCSSQSWCSPCMR